MSIIDEVNVLDAAGKETVRLAAETLLNNNLSIVNKRIEDIGEIRGIKLHARSISVKLALLGINQLIDVECDDFFIDEDNTIHLNHFKSSALSVENALNRFVTGTRSFEGDSANMAITLARKVLY